MKKSFHSLRILPALAALAAGASTAGAVTFTTNTLISFNNTNYDGQDIAITNCTVTVDGGHAFASVQIFNGGVLTHSFAPNGLLTNLVSIVGEQHVFSSTNPATLAQAAVLANTIVVTDVTGTNIYRLGLDYALWYTNGYGGNAIIFVPGSTIPDGAVILVNYEALASPIGTGLNLAVSNNVEIEIGGAIDASGRGYGAGLGPGAGKTAFSQSPFPYFAGGGGGFGGSGGPSSSQAPGGSGYGTIDTPNGNNKGSGGGAGAGSGGAGGGGITLAVGGLLRVDGEIAANGTGGLNLNSGGGSGGGIQLSAQTFSGAGAVSAQGGAGDLYDGGGGGGGRIQVSFVTNQFAGSMAAQGGAGATYGGAGTIYRKANNISQQPGQVVIDNAGTQGAQTIWSAGSGLDLQVNGGAVLAISQATAVSFNSLAIGSNSWVTTNTDGFVFDFGYGLALNVTSNALVQVGGAITLDGKGYYSGGPGPGGSVTTTQYGTTGGGGGNGGPGGAGLGGAPGGRNYASVAQPASAGSAGGAGEGSQNLNGGPGGGTIRMTVGGTLTLNGSITANGAAGNAPGSGGGAGGSIWLVATSLVGNGILSADGGSGDLQFGGGGGGGGIAVYSTNNQFAGTVSAYGGPGVNYGGAGTIYYAPGKNGATQMILDNGGWSGPGTTIGNLSECDITISGNAGAAVDPSNPIGPIGNLVIASNSSLLFSNKYLRTVNLVVTSNATVAAGASIALDGQGSPAGTGEGPGRTAFGVGGGGGYGGYGGAGGATNTAAGGVYYGSMTQPLFLGSGGGGSNAGAGGGGLQMTVSGLLTLNGAITANGSAAVGTGSGGGSGGSLWLTVGGFSGAGILSANGGAGDAPLGGGGAGGRVAIYYGTNLFTGNVAVHGGPGANEGGAGTLYYQARNGAAQVIVNNGGVPGQGTVLANPGVPYNLTIMGGAVALSATPQATLGTINNLLIATNASLLFSNQGQASVILTVASNATIQSGGNIALDGQAFSGQGTGQSSLYAGGGGGYGGYGGAGGTNQAAGGTAYGLATEPTSPGSPGGRVYPIQPIVGVGGPGGGALQMNVRGALYLDGSISANGLPGISQGSGGGSGGSLWLTVGQLSGAGVIAANGGSGDAPLGGGGAGGRIAIYFSTNHFAGIVSAHGGSGANYGGAGTIYYQPNGVAPRQLIVDDGGATGAALTPLSELNLQAGNVTISGGAAALATQGSLNEPASLLIASNSWLVFTSSFQIFNPAINVNGNVTVQSGGGILLDGAGSAPGTGLGAGASQGGGGGHGGAGGAGATNQAAGGTAYDSVSAPTTVGSGGGGPNIFGNPSASAGFGGGALELFVVGTLQLDGKISANGTTGFAQRSGGGAGGSIWLNAGLFSGAGAISANGGAGDPGLGGGGGGGRIAIYANSNLFTGSLSAYGGAGANYGGAGTIYSGPYRTGNGRVSLLVDNGGFRGTNTPLGSPLNVFALTLTGGAVVTCTNGGIIGNLLINSNATLGSFPQQSLALTITNTATVLAGGGIVCDGRGLPGGEGPGAGGSSYSPGYGETGGGGGYGGAGGRSLVGASGGPANGSLLPPFMVGSGGGGYPTPTSGGAGGGSLQLMVSNVLTVDGIITANGAGANYDGAGGGSGGGISLNVGGLSGTGAISANGGSGDPHYGGGGGGGRIAINCISNAFTGVISAHGGPGANFGGAGTVYSNTNGGGAGHVLVDNGGSKGAATPLSLNQPYDLTVSGGAITYPASDLSFVLSSLSVSSGATMVGGIDQSNVFNPGYNITMTVLGNALVGSNAAISVDSQGYSAPNGGPGVGQMATNGSGSGGGYGGAGGSSATGTPGGIAYGSATQPINWGSSGGLNPVYPNLCQGGGAIRLMVGGDLSVNGALSANGDAALFPRSGGGAGGSIWITARAIDGNGIIRANGGPGYAAQGGGGGGGRIALYTRTNDFAGVIAVQGGAGASPGQNGTVVTTNIPLPQVIAQSPTGVVFYAVSNVVLTFGSPMNFALVTGTDVTVDTPNGELPASAAGVTPAGLTTLQINFPAQNTIGYYDVQAGPNLLDIYGLPVSPTYIGSFILLPPIISGQVTDTNGQPVAYVTMRPSGGITPVLTDTNGLYEVEVPPSWTGVITPSKGEAMFIPASRSYANVSGDITNQNFVEVSPAALTLTAQCQGTNVNLCWHGINGVTYQALYSTDLVNWFPCGAPQAGTNAMMQVQMPIDSQPAMFFRFSTSYGLEDSRFQRLVKEQIGPANH